MWMLWVEVAAWQQWVRRLGAFGLVIVGVLDHSVVPLPGSMDALTIILSASNRTWWPVYAVVAVASSMLGAYLTYRVASKGGKETLEKRVGKQRAEKAYRKFEKGGFATVFAGCILPPPFPLVPVIMAAGAMQYPTRKFLGAVAGGRSVRYGALAYIGHRYGEGILSFFAQYQKPLLYTVIGMGILGASAVALYFGWYRRRQQPATG